MPFVTVKLIEGVFDDDQKREMIEKLTDTMVEIEGENMRGVTWVVVEEVDERRLGDRRQRRCTTEDVTALAGGACPRSVASIGRVGRRHRTARSRARRPCERRRRPHRATRSTATGDETILLLPPWSIVHSRFWKAQVPYLARHFRVVTFDAARQRRARTAPRRAEAYGPRDVAATPLAVLDAAGVARRACVVRALRQRGARAAARRRAPRARARRGLHRRPRCRITPPLPERTALLRRRAATTDEGWAKAQPPLLGARLPRLPRVLLRAAASPSRTRPSSSRTRSRGGSRRRRDARADVRGDEGLDRETVDELLVPRVALPGRSSSRATRTRWSRPTAARAFAELTGAELVDARGRRPLPAGARSGPGQPPAARLRRARLRPPARPAPWRRAIAGRSARSSSPRRSASATRGATSRSRASCAPAAPGPRDRLARAGPGHARARGLRRAHPSGERGSWPTSRATSTPRSREHELHVLPGDPADGRDPAARTSWSSTTSSRDEPLRPLDRRRGVGARLLPAREPRAEDARRTLG